jgi:hypothetical protein
MAIVAHYVNKDGHLGMYVLSLITSNSNTGFDAEELLIDFWELIGKHSGENMADAVWETLIMYGIESRVAMTCNLSELIC